MNQKDYKAISEIIKKNTFKQDNMPVIDTYVIKELSDYFEIEDIIDNSIPNEEEREKSLIPSKAPNFNKEQFRKGCRVE